MYKKIIFAILFILVVGVAYYGISPLFRNISLDEPTPKSTETTVTNTTLEVASNTPSTRTEVTPEKQQTGSVLRVESSTSIKGTVGHPASGVVKIIAADGANILRYENFKTINGPDLYVYLSKDLEAKDYINLGKIKATEGNINYEIPKNVNIKDYSYVIVWCKAFEVLFNSADISDLVK